MNQQNKSDALEILIILAMFLLVLVICACSYMGRRNILRKRKSLPDAKFK